MTTNKKIVKIPHDIVIQLEAFSYEIQARKDVISFCLDRGMDLNTPTFQEYHKELVDFLAQYNILKNEMANEYILKEYPDNKWYLDFSTEEVTIEIDEEKK